MDGTSDVDDGEPTGPLAEALLTLMRDRHVGPTHIWRYSGVAKNTVRQILAGTTREPKQETLKRIADAIATAWYPPYARDDQMAVSWYRVLHRAAGYGDVMSDTPDTFAEMGLLSLVGARSQARAWKRLVERNRHLQEAEIERLDPSRDADEPTGLSTE